MTGFYSVNLLSIAWPIRPSRPWCKWSMSTVPGHGILTHIPNIGFNPCVPSPNVFSENHVPTAKERCQDYGLQSATHYGGVTGHPSNQILRMGGVLHQPDR